MHALLANYLVRWSMGQPDMRGRNFGRISTPSKMLLKANLARRPASRRPWQCASAQPPASPAALPPSWPWS